MKAKTSGVLIVCMMIAGAHGSWGQVVLTGMVTDSASMQALPNVNLVSKKTGRGTISDLRGGFVLQASAGDSIVFSRVGYKTKILPVREIRNLVIITLKEEHRMLKPVEVIDTSRLSWLPKIPPENPWTTRTTERKTTDMPGFQGVQTFGPGYVFKGALSRLSKEAREKRKLAVVKEENYRASGYVGLVNDPTIKGKIMKEHGLTDAQYYELLALFNQKHGTAIYGLENHEIVALLVRFYSQHAPDRE